jgi:hypothetical protein
MVEALANVVSAFGLSASAGLNAYLPLLIVGLMARFTELIVLQEPWNALENPWVLGVLGLLTVIEITVDKIPAVDTVNDGIQTFVRPVAGAILFAASSSVISDVHPALAMICGLLVAGGVHAAKATARPFVTGASIGAGNPVVSAAEDVVAATTSVLSIVIPMLVAVIVLLGLAVLIWWIWRRRRRARRVAWQ